MTASEQGAPEWGLARQDAFRSALRQMFHVALQRLSDTGVVAIAPEELAGLTEQVRVTADPKFGDYSGTMAMALAKRAGRKPRDMAAEIISRLDVGELFDPPGEPVGPGFINLRVSDAALARHSGDVVRTTFLRCSREPSPQAADLGNDHRRAPSGASASCASPS